METHYLIAHDLGTSGNKASLFSTSGELIRSYTVNYPVHYFGEGCAEQDPDDWWKAVCQATLHITQGIKKESILAISFSAQMQCCLIVDKKGIPLRKAIIWSDQRAQKQAKQLEERIGGNQMYQITGHRVSPSYSLEKLMWIKEEEPELYKQTAYMLQVKDYIIYKLTGEFVTDYSDASGTNALDLTSLCWSKKILDAAQVDMDKFPPLHHSTDIIGPLTKEASASVGLTPSTLVVCGGGDGPCSAVGAGCIESNELFMTFGTSSWIGATTPVVFLDKDQILFCFAHVIPGHYMPCGTMQSAGSAYAYITELLCQEEKERAKDTNVDFYSLLEESIHASPIGANGLLFLPYLLGERSPRWNPNCSGSFLGMRMGQNRNDYLRSTLEGIAMNLELILQSYRHNLTINNMILTGGGAKGDALCQILADVLNITLHRPNNVKEATSIAAALIAGIGIGAFKDFRDIKRFITIKDQVNPILDHSEFYEKRKEVFQSAYHALLPLYHKL